MAAPGRPDPRPQARTPSAGRPGLVPTEPHRASAPGPLGTDHPFGAEDVRGRLLRGFLRPDTDGMPMRDGCPAPGPGEWPGGDPVQRTPSRSGPGQSRERPERDRQAPADRRPRPAGGPVRRCLPESTPEVPPEGRLRAAEGIAHASRADPLHPDGGLLLAEAGGDHRRPGRSSDPGRSPHRRPRRTQGGQGAPGGPAKGAWEDRLALPDRGGRGREPRRHHQGGPLPDRRRADTPRPGEGIQGHGTCLPEAGAHHPAVLLRQPLPPHVVASARGADVPLEQRRCIARSSRPSRF